VIIPSHGNLLESDAEAVVNTVNCVGVMGKGIALHFKQAYPELLPVYEQLCKQGRLMPGRMQVLPTNRVVGPRFVINFPTKRHWKDKSKLADIEAGLLALVQEVRAHGIRRIALPALGCGNGGLDWSEVRPRIEAAFAALPEVDVLLYPPSVLPNAGMRAS
jgi:O-acetyl-ADP-ribose deacetylase (regulator of RNase III)